LTLNYVAELKTTKITQLISSSAQRNKNEETDIVAFAKLSTVNQHVD